MNYIKNHTPLSFCGNVLVKRTSFFDARKICNFDIEHKNFKTLNVSTTRSKNTRERFTTKIKTKNNTTLANESLTINQKNNEMYGINIKTNERYRNNSLGEILRLSSIIIMFENNIQNFRIFALKKSENFHKKYFFKPVISNTSENSFLSNIGTEMILTKEDILENKNFYNELFKKYGINYHI